MDQGWKQLPLFAIILLLSNAYGFKGGASSNAHHRWGQSSDYAFSPHAVQSSVSEVPVTGILPEEMGPLKRLNLLQFGSVSTYPSVALSSAQGAVSQSAKVQSPWNQFTSSYDTQSGSSTPFNLQGSTTYGGSLKLQGTTSQFASGSPSSYPSVALSSPQGSVSQPATVQSPWKQFTFTGSSGTQQGSSTPFNLQGSTAYGGSLQHQGTTSQFASGSPSSYPSVALSSPQGAVSDSATVQSSQKQFTSSYDTQQGSSTPFNLQGSTAYGGSLQHQGTTSQFASGSPSSYPSVAVSSPQGAVSQSATVQSPWKQFTSTFTGSSGTQLGSSTPFNLQGSTAYGGSLQHQGTTSQFASGSPSSYPSVALSSSQGSVSQSATVQSPWKQFTSTLTGSSGTQSGSSTPFNLQGSTAYGGSLQHQGTTSQFASGSPSSYPSVALSSPQGSVSQPATVQSPWKQFTFTGSSGTQQGSSTPFNLQGSTTYGGSLQHQGTTSQFASGSPSSYPSVELSSPQGSVSQPATVQSPWKQFTFTGSSGTQQGSSTPFNLQGSTTYGGSLQHQGTTSQFASGSPSSYPSVALSSPQGSVSQSATVQSPWKQFTFTGSSGTQQGSSTPFNLQGSTAYGGSLQHQGTTSQFASGSPSSYPSVALSSPQGSVSQPATVQSPWKQFTFTGSSGTQQGSSTPFNLQGSTTYGGSLQHQGTTSQFASGSPSSYPSVALSSPQGSVSQSATVQSPWKQFTFTGSSGTQQGSSTPFNLQGSTAYGGSLQHQGTTSQFASGSPSSYPSVALSSPQGSVSQPATVQSPWKQFTFTGSSGTQQGSSTPFNLQGSTTYGGSLQHQGTTSQFASGSPSSYPSVALSSPQGSVSQPATVQSPWKQFTFTGSSGTQQGSSTPFNLQGSTAYGGSLQHQGTTSQFASGSPSSYPSVALSSPQGAVSQSAIVQSPWKQFTSTFTGSSGTQQGSSTPFNLQGSTAYGGSLQHQGTTSQFASGSPSSYPSVALSSPQGAVSESATVQSPWKQFTFTGSSGTQQGSSTPFNLQGSTTYDGSLQHQGTTSQFASGSPSYPSVALSSPQGAVSESATVQSPWKQFTSSYDTQQGSSNPFNLQGSTAYGGSLQHQGTTSQFASGSPSSYPSVALSSPQGAVGQSATVQSPWKQFTSTLTGSSGTQSGSSTPFNLQGSTAYGGSLQHQGTTSQFASGSPSSYPSVAVSSPQGAVSQSATVQSPWKQFTFTGSSGTQQGSSTPFNLQGSTAYGGSLQHQGTTSQFASGSPSYPSVALSSPQGAVSLSAIVQSPWKQFTSTFTGSSGTQQGSSTPFNLQGSTAYGGSLQHQGTTSQFASGSPSSYPSVALSSPQGSVSQSATVQSPWKQFTPSYDTQQGSSTPFNLQGSTAYGGSLQHQGTTSQFASGSPSSYPSVAVSSPQGAVSQSATVQSPWKQFTFTGSSGTQQGSSTPFNLQGSTAYGGSLQHQGTTSQFASGSPSFYPSVALSSPQGSVSQSATVQSPWKQFTSTLTGSSGTQQGSSTPFNLQGSTAYGGSLQHQGTTSQFASGSPSSYPSVALSSPQGSVSQSATVQSPWKQFTPSYDTQQGSSTPFNLQGSTAYGGSLQHQGTTSQFASGSPSSYPSVAVSSPQGAVSQSATVQSPWKQFTFTGSSGTQQGSSTPFNLQGSTAYGGSLQHQGTTSQFASGSPSFYPSVALSSPQGSVSQSATVQSPWKQFTSTLTGSSGTQSGSSTPFNLQGSTTYGGSLQHQGTTSQFASGSPSSYPSVALSSPQGAVSQSATVQSPWKQFTSSYDTQQGSSTPFNLQGSTTYGGSLQHQGATSQFASGPPSYPSVAVSSPQGAVSQSATVQSPWKQFTSTFTGSSGTQLGSSIPFNLQGSTAYGGSLQHQGTTSQFASGPPSYPSVALSSPQGAVSESATVQSPWKQFTAVSSQSTSDQRSNGLYISDSR